MSHNHRHSRHEDFLENQEQQRQQQHEENNVDRCKNNNNNHKETSNNENNNNDDVDETVIMLRCIEFYSGVGGWTMALQQVVKMLNDMIVDDDDPIADDNDDDDNDKHRQKYGRKRKKFQLHCCAHLDHSDLCNDVYQYNHCCNNKNKKKHPIRIETLTVEQIIQWNASIWMMSPPCQPHTRQRQQPQFPNVVIDDDNSTTEDPPISLQNNEEERQQQHEQYSKTGMKRKKCNEIDNNSNSTSNSTNNGNSNGIDVDDIRSNSFLYLCTLLQSNQIPKQYLPKMILLENVIGFEESKSCLDYWLPALQSHKYHIGQFTIQPHQVNIPNDRPRYYCVAVLLSDNEVKQRESNLLSKYLKPVRWGQSDNINSNKNCNHDECTDMNLDHVLITSIPELDVMELSDDSNDATNTKDTSNLPEIRQFIDEQNNDINYDDHDDIQKQRKSSSTLVISDVVLRKRSSWCMDIVKLSDRRSSCFTSAYGKYSKGTGSVLLVPLHPSDDDTIKTTSLLLSPETREYNPNWAEELCLFENSTLSRQEQNSTTTNGANGSVIHDRRRRRCMLRYFSGIEIARLMGFPSTFEFPSHITMKQQWKLIGNSLNVQVAAKCIELALRVQYNIPTTNHQSTT